MVKIRLKREGRKNMPCYGIVIADARSPRDGKFIEKIGYYSPLDKNKVVSFKEDRIKYWLSQGAQPTKIVHKILARSNILPSLSFKNKE